MLIHMLTQLFTLLLTRFISIICIIKRKIGKLKKKNNNDNKKAKEENKQKFKYRFGNKGTNKVQVKFATNKI